jgi:2-hydroxychromene-2-carboxylate isomerase
VTLSPLQSDRPLIVYLDFKSPYAYLARRPTAEMARRLGIAVDWRPFVLDIPSYLGSARLDDAGKVVESRRTPEQWSGVKYAYFDCRRYARLEGLTVRGTVKIWDTNLAAIGMLWAKRCGDAVVERYIDAIYAPFWRRELDLEDAAVITHLLGEAGASMAGFDDYARGEGAAANAALQAAAFDAGIFGVPTYLVNGERYFGREHLPRVAWHLGGEQGPAPDIANPLPAGAAVAPAERLAVCVDFKSPQSYLAVAPTLALARELGISMCWLPRRVPAVRRPASPAAGADRGTRHRCFRAAYLEQDLTRYAPHPLTDVHAEFDSGVAAMGLLWLQDERSADAARCDAYVERIFRRFWRDGEPIDRVESIAAGIADVGVDAAGFADYVSSRGPAALAGCEDRLAALGVGGVPTYLLDDEPHLGRQHLPLIRARLCARPGGTGLE